MHGHKRPNKKWAKCKFVNARTESGGAWYAVWRRPEELLSIGAPKPDDLDRASEPTTTEATTRSAAPETQTTETAEIEPGAVPKTARETVTSRSSQQLRTTITRALIADDPQPLSSSYAAPRTVRPRPRMDLEHFLRSLAV